jgi:hypothetical protein
MGHELRRMIRDGAPAAWTPFMRLVASEIADDARDPSQGMPEDATWPWSAIPVSGCWQGGKWRDGLAERTGLSERHIRRALADLRNAGYEMRQSIGVDKRGRPVYAAKGHAVRFQVPSLPPRSVPESRTDTATFKPSKGGQIGPQRWPDPAPKVDAGGHPISPGSPHSLLTLNQSAVNRSVEGSDGAFGQTIDQDQDGDNGKDTCPECGQQAELMRTMTGQVIRSHNRGRDGEAFCPGTGQPSAGEVVPS